MAREAQRLDMNDRELLKRYGHVLTPKEHEVLTLTTKGLSQRTIALHLHLGRSAVQSRLENALRKLRDAREQEAA